MLVEGRNCKSVQDWEQRKVHSWGDDGNVCTHNLRSHSTVSCVSPLFFLDILEGDYPFVRGV